MAEVSQARSKTAALGLYFVPEPDVTTYLLTCLAVSTAGLLVAVIKCFRCLKS